MSSRQCLVESDNRRELLSRMKQALLRMEIDGASVDNCEHYSDLLKKYNEISLGADYEVSNVAPAMVAVFGGMIPYSNVSTSGKRLLPRGDLRDAVKSSVKFYNTLDK